MRNYLAPVLLILAGACASAPATGAGPAPAAPRAASPNHPGFDLGRYPGDDALRAWRGVAPYEWVGYYLPAPCHRDASWSGKRAAIQAMGYGFAVIYVGQQQFESDTAVVLPGTPLVCSRALLTADRGRADAADAIARTAFEGFPGGTAVFLDVERFTTLSPELSAYVGAWTEAMRRDGRFRPALYAHRENAAVLRPVVEGAAGAPVPFWVAGGPNFSLERTPRESGVDFATVWQGLPAPRTWAGVTLTIDENVSTTASPSAP
ncbi:MAG TPA: glycoside hydrolase domain-containing protein [Longimicrobium sp.]|jgi:hypothetical protein